MSKTSCIGLRPFLPGTLDSWFCVPFETFGGSPEAEGRVELQAVVEKELALRFSTRRTLRKRFPG
jgi:hypothetical protein